MVSIAVLTFIHLGILRKAGIAEPTASLERLPFCKQHNICVSTTLRNSATRSYSAIMSQTSHEHNHRVGK